MFPNIRHGKYVDTFFLEERQKKNNKMKKKPNTAEKQQLK